MNQYCLITLYDTNTKNKKIRIRYTEFHEYLTLQILKAFLVSLFPYLTTYYALSKCYQKSARATVVALLVFMANFEQVNTC